MRAAVWLVGLALTAVCCVSVPRMVQAQGSDTIEATVLLRALSYDSSLKSRAGNLMVVAVLYNPADSASKAQADKTYAAFSKLEKVKVQGLKLQAVSVPYDDSGGLRALIERDGVDLVYVCPGLSSKISKISGVSRELHVLTAAARRKDVADGLSLGVFEQSNKRIIVVNLAASKAEGASFSAQFLSLAEVLR